MSKSKALEACIELEELISKSSSLIEVFDSVAGDTPPCWLGVWSDQLRAISDSVDVVGRLVREELRT